MRISCVAVRRPDHKPAKRFQIWAKTKRKQEVPVKGAPLPPYLEPRRAHNWVLPIWIGRFLISMHLTACLTQFDFLAMPL